MDGSVISSSSSSSSAASSTSSSLSIGGGSDVEAGFSGSSAPFPMYGSSYFSGGGMRRKGSCKAMASPRSPRSGPRFFFDPVFDDEPGHFLDSCFLCKKPLGGHRDIFMYKGDTPFCSEECRQEQIEMDEAKEKKWKMTSSAKAAAAATRKENQPSSASNSGDSYVRAAAGTVVAG